jgi:hypothetical protein
MPSSGLRAQRNPNPPATNAKGRPVAGPALRLSQGPIAYAAIRAASGSFVIS